MKNSAFESFSESAQDALDFARCQRPDGSFYGTSGQCRKGVSVGAKEKAELKKAAAGGNKRAQKALDKLDGKTAESKKTGAPSQAEVRALDKAAKAANKEADAADKAWRKAGGPKDESQKRVLALDKKAKAADKAADKANRDFEKASGKTDAMKGLKKEYSQIKKDRYANKEPWKAEDAMHNKLAKLDRTSAARVKKVRASQAKLDSISDKNSSEWKSEAKRYDKALDSVRDRADQLFGAA